MPLYEHVFLARQDVSAQQVEALTKEFTDVLEAGGGKVAKSEYWGVRSLAFKMKKARKAHYTLFNIDAPPAAVSEMERRMGLSTDIIRFLTIKVDKHQTDPSIMMRKGDRDERGERGDRPPFRGGDRGGGFRGGDRGGFRGGDRGGGGGFRGGDRPRGDREESTPRPEGEAAGPALRPRAPQTGEREGDAPPRAPRPPRETKPAEEA